MNRKKTTLGVSLRRVLSIALVLVYVVTNHSVPEALTFEMSQSSFSSQKPLEVFDLRLPGSLGKIQEISQGDGKEVVILIQDAHAVPDAQKSIQRSIYHFQKEYGFGLVGIEGASKKLDAQIFHSFPDRELLNGVLQEYFKKGELAGVNAALLMNPNSGLYYGIEDWGLYEQGTQLFLKAMEEQETVANLLNVAHEQLQNEKKETYSEKLFDIDQTLTAFYENYEDLIPVLQKLSSILPPDYDSELALLLESADREGSSDSFMRQEVKKIAQKIRAHLHSLPPTDEQVKQGLARFNNAVQQFQTSMIPLEEFALTLRDLAQEFKVRIKVSKRLHYLVSSQRRMKDIQGTRLFYDFELYAAKVKESLYRNEEERKLDQKSQRFQIFKRLSRLELTRGDWKGLKQLLRELNYWTITADQLSSSAFSSLIQSMEAHLAFYQVAENRDEAFAQNLLKLMKENLVDRSILVLGGFHTEGLTKRLKKRGISYALVTPQIQKLPKEINYHAHMQGEVTWGDYFEIEDDSISVYKAFVRATRDLLLKGLSSSKARGTVPGKYASEGALIKQWRDQLIRDLSEQGRVSESRNYTQFIDEIVEGGSKTDWRSKWAANVEKFIKSLRFLESKNALTEQNIMKLLPPANSADVATYNVLSYGDRASLASIPSIGRGLGTRISMDALLQQMANETERTQAASLQTKQEGQDVVSKDGERLEARIILVHEFQVTVGEFLPSFTAVVQEENGVTYTTFYAAKRDQLVNNPGKMQETKMATLPGSIDEQMQQGGGGWDTSKPERGIHRYQTTFRTDQGGFNFIYTIREKKREGLQASHRIHHRDISAGPMFVEIIPEYDGSRNEIGFKHEELSNRSYYNRRKKDPLLTGLDIKQVIETKKDGDYFSVTVRDDRDDIYEIRFAHRRVEALALAAEAARLADTPESDTHFASKVRPYLTREVPVTVEKKSREEFPSFEELPIPREGEIVAAPVEVLTVESDVQEDQEVQTLEPYSEEDLNPYIKAVKNRLSFVSVAHANDPEALGANIEQAEAGLADIRERLNKSGKEEIVAAALKDPRTGLQSALDSKENSIRQAKNALAKMEQIRKKIQRQGKSKFVGDYLAYQFRRARMPKAEEKYGFYRFALEEYLLEQGRQRGFVQGVEEDFSGYHQRSENQSKLLNALRGDLDEFERVRNLAKPDKWNLAKIDRTEFNFLDDDEIEAWQSLQRAIRRYFRDSRSQESFYNLQKAAKNFSHVFHHFGYHVDFYHVQGLSARLAEVLIGPVVIHEDRREDGSKFRSYEVQNERASKPVRYYSETEGYVLGEYEPVVNRNKKSIALHFEALNKAQRRLATSERDAVSYKDRLKVRGAWWLSRDQKTFGDAYIESVLVHEKRHYWNRDYGVFEEALQQKDFSPFFSTPFNSFLGKVKGAQKLSGDESLIFDFMAAEEVSAFLAQLAVGPMPVYDLADLFSRVEDVFPLSEQDRKTVTLNNLDQEALEEIEEHGLAAIEILNLLLKRLANQGHLEEVNLFELTYDQLQQVGAQVTDLFINGTLSERDLGEFADNAFGLGELAEETFNQQFAGHSLFLGNYAPRKKLQQDEQQTIAQRNEAFRLYYEISALDALPRVADSEVMNERFQSIKGIKAQVEVQTAENPFLSFELANHQTIEKYVRAVALDLELIEDLLAFEIDPDNLGDAEVTLGYFEEDLRRRNIDESLSRFYQQVNAALQTLQTLEEIMQKPLGERKKWVRSVQRNLTESKLGKHLEMVRVRHNRVANIVGVQVALAEIMSTEMEGAALGVKLGDQQRKLFDADAEEKFGDSLDALRQDYAKAETYLKDADEARKLEREIGRTAESLNVQDGATITTAESSLAGFEERLARMTTNKFKGRAGGVLQNLREGIRITRRDNEILQLEEKIEALAIPDPFDAARRVVDYDNVLAEIGTYDQEHQRLEGEGGHVVSLLNLIRDKREATQHAIKATGLITYINAIDGTQVSSYREDRRAYNSLSSRMYFNELIGNPHREGLEAAYAAKKTALDQTLQGETSRIQQALAGIEILDPLEPTRLKSDYDGVEPRVLKLEQDWNALGDDESRVVPEAIEKTRTRLQYAVSSMELAQKIREIDGTQSFSYRGDKDKYDALAERVTQLDAASNPYGEGLLGVYAEKGERLKLTVEQENSRVRDAMALVEIPDPLEVGRVATDFDSVTGRIDQLETAWNALGADGDDSMGESIHETRTTLRFAMSTLESVQKIRAIDGTQVSSYREDRKRYNELSGEFMGEDFERNPYRDRLRQARWAKGDELNETLSSAIASIQEKIRVIEIPDPLVVGRSAADYEDVDLSLAEIERDWEIVKGDFRMLNGVGPKKDFEEAIEGRRTTFRYAVGGMELAHKIRAIDGNQIATFEQDQQSMDELWDELDPYIGAKNPYGAALLTLYKEKSEVVDRTGSKFLVIKSASELNITTSDGIREMQQREGRLKENLESFREGSDEYKALADAIVERLLDGIQNLAINILDREDVKSVDRRLDQIAAIGRAIFEKNPTYEQRVSNARTDRIGLQGRASVAASYANGLLQADVGKGVKLPDYLRFNIDKQAEIREARETIIEEARRISANEPLLLQQIEAVNAGVEARNTARNYNPAGRALQAITRASDRDALEEQRDVVQALSGNPFYQELVQAFNDRAAEGAMTGVSPISREESREVTARKLLMSNGLNPGHVQSKEVVMNRIIDQFPDNAEDQKGMVALLKAVAKDVRDEYEKGMFLSDAFVRVATDYTLVSSNGTGQVIDIVLPSGKSFRYTYQSGKISHEELTPPSAPEVAPEDESAQKLALDELVAAGDSLEEAYRILMRRYAEEDDQFALSNLVLYLMQEEHELTRVEIAKLLASVLPLQLSKSVTNEDGARFLGYYNYIKTDLDAFKAFMQQIVSIRDTNFTDRLLAQNYQWGEDLIDSVLGLVSKDLYDEHKSTPLESVERDAQGRMPRAAFLYDSFLRAPTTGRALILRMLIFDNKLLSAAAKKEELKIPLRLQAYSYLAAKGVLKPEAYIAFRDEFIGSPKVLRTIHPDRMKDKTLNELVPSGLSLSLALNVYGTAATRLGSDILGLSLEEEQRIFGSAVAKAGLYLKHADEVESPNANSSYRISRGTFERHQVLHVFAVLGHEFMHNALDGLGIPTPDGVRYRSFSHGLHEMTSDVMKYAFADIYGYPLEDMSKNRKMLLEESENAGDPQDPLEGHRLGRGVLAGFLSQHDASKINWVVFSKNLYSKIKEEVAVAGISVGDEVEALEKSDVLFKHFLEKYDVRLDEFTTEESRYKEILHRLMAETLQQTLAEQAAPGYQKRTFAYITPVDDPSTIKGPLTADEVVRKESREPQDAGDASKSESEPERLRRLNQNWFRLDTVRVHGQVMVDPNGKGIMILGESFSRKSSLTAKLLSAYPEFKIVADDEFSLTVENGQIYATSVKGQTYFKYRIEVAENQMQWVDYVIDPKQIHRGIIKIDTLLYLTDKDVTEVEFESAPALSGRDMLELLRFRKRSDQPSHEFDQLSPINDGEIPMWNALFPLLKQQYHPPKGLDALVDTIFPREESHLRQEDSVRQVAEEQRKVDEAQDPVDVTRQSRMRAIFDRNGDFDPAEMTLEDRIYFFNQLHESVRDYRLDKESGWIFDSKQAFAKEGQYLLETLLKNDYFRSSHFDEFIENLIGKSLVKDFDNILNSYEQRVRGQYAHLPADELDRKVDFEKEALERRVTNNTRINIRLGIRYLSEEFENQRLPGTMLEPSLKTRLAFMVFHESNFVTANVVWELIKNTSKGAVMPLFFIAAEASLGWIGAILVGLVVYWLGRVFEDYLKLLIKPWLSKLEVAKGARVRLYRQQSYNFLMGYEAGEFREDLSRNRERWIGNKETDPSKLSVQQRLMQTTGFNQEHEFVLDEIQEMAQSAFEQGRWYSKDDQSYRRVDVILNQVHAYLGSAFASVENPKELSAEDLVYTAASMALFEILNAESVPDSYWNELEKHLQKTGYLTHRQTIARNKIANLMRVLRENFDRNEYKSEFIRAKSDLYTLDTPLAGIGSVQRLFRKHLIPSERQGYDRAYFENVLDQVRSLEPQHRERVLTASFQMDLFRLKDLNDPTKKERGIKIDPEYIQRKLEVARLWEMRLTDLEDKENDYGLREGEFQIWLEHLKSEKRLVLRNLLENELTRENHSLIEPVLNELDQMVTDAAGEDERARLSHLSIDVSRLAPMIRNIKKKSPVEDYDSQITQDFIARVSDTKLLGERESAIKAAANFSQQAVLAGRAARAPPVQQADETQERRERFREFFAKEDFDPSKLPKEDRVYFYERLLDSVQEYRKADVIDEQGWDFDGKRQFFRQGRPLHDTLLKNNYFHSKAFRNFIYELLGDIDASGAELREDLQAAAGRSKGQEKRALEEQASKVHRMVFEMRVNFGLTIRYITSEFEKGKLSDTRINPPTGQRLWYLVARETTSVIINATNSFLAKVIYSLTLAIGFQNLLAILGITSMVSGPGIALGILVFVAAVAFQEYLKSYVIKPRLKKIDFGAKAYQRLYHKNIYNDVMSDSEEKYASDVREFKKGWNELLERIENRSGRSASQQEVDVLIYAQRMVLQAFEKESWYPKVNDSYRRFQIALKVAETALEINEDASVMEVATAVLNEIADADFVPNSFWESWIQKTQARSVGSDADYAKYMRRFRDQIEFAFKNKRKDVLDPSIDEAMKIAEGTDLEDAHLLRLFLTSRRTDEELYNYNTHLLNHRFSSIEQQEEDQRGSSLASYFYGDAHRLRDLHDEKKRNIRLYVRPVYANQIVQRGLIWDRYLEEIKGEADKWGLSEEIIESWIEFLRDQRRHVVSFRTALHLVKDTKTQEPVSLPEQVASIQNVNHEDVNVATRQVEELYERTQQVISDNRLTLASDTLNRIFSDDILFVQYLAELGSVNNFDSEAIQNALRQIQPVVEEQSPAFLLTSQENSAQIRQESRKRATYFDDQLTPDEMAEVLKEQWAPWLRLYQLDLSRIRLKVELQDLETLEVKFFEQDESDPAVWDHLFVKGFDGVGRHASVRLNHRDLFSPKRDVRRSSITQFRTTLLPGIEEEMFVGLLAWLKSRGFDEVNVDTYGILRDVKYKKIIRKYFQRKGTWFKQSKYKDPNLKLDLSELVIPDDLVVPDVVYQPLTPQLNKVHIKPIDDLAVDGELLSVGSLRQPWRTVTSLEHELFRAHDDKERLETLQETESYSELRRSEILRLETEIAQMEEALDNLKSRVEYQNYYDQGTYDVALDAYQRDIELIMDYQKQGMAYEYVNQNMAIAYHNLLMRLKPIFQDSGGELATFVYPLSGPDIFLAAIGHLHPLQDDLNDFNGGVFLLDQVYGQGEGERQIVKSQPVWTQRDARDPSQYDFLKAERSGNNPHILVLKGLSWIGEGGDAEAPYRLFNDILDRMQVGDRIFVLYGKDMDLIQQGVLEGRLRAVASMRGSPKIEIPDDRKDLLAMSTPVGKIVMAPEPEAVGVFEKIQDEPTLFSPKDRRESRKEKLAQDEAEIEYVRYKALSDDEKAKMKEGIAKNLNVTGIDALDNSEKDAWIAKFRLPGDGLDDYEVAAVDIFFTAKHSPVLYSLGTSVGEFWRGGIENLNLSRRIRQRTLSYAYEAGMKKIDEDGIVAELNSLDVPFVESVSFDPNNLIVPKSVTSKLWEFIKYYLGLVKADERDYRTIYSSTRFPDTIFKRYFGVRESRHFFNIQSQPRFTVRPNKTIYYDSSDLLDHLEVEGLVWTEEMVRFRDANSGQDRSSPVRRQRRGISLIHLEAEGASDKILAEAEARYLEMDRELWRYGAFNADSKPSNYLVAYGRDDDGKKVLQTEILEDGREVLSLRLFDLEHVHSFPVDEGPEPIYKFLATPAQSETNRFFSPGEHFLNLLFHQGSDTNEVVRNRFQRMQGLRKELFPQLEEGVELRDRDDAPFQVDINTVHEIYEEATIAMNETYEGLLREQRKKTQDHPEGIIKVKEAFFEKLREGNEGRNRIVIEYLLSELAQEMHDTREVYVQERKAKLSQQREQVRKRVQEITEELKDFQHRLDKQYAYLDRGNVVEPTEEQVRRSIEILEQKSFKLRLEVDRLRSQLRDIRAVFQGDIHAHLEPLYKNLSESGLLTPDNEWQGNEGDFLVQVGDYIDYGEQSMEVDDQLRVWQKSAREKQAQGVETGVIRLIGNHELALLIFMSSEATSVNEMIGEVGILGSQQVTDEMRAESKASGEDIYTVLRRHIREDPKTPYYHVYRKLVRDILRGNIQAASSLQDKLGTHAGVDLEEVQPEIDATILEKFQVTRQPIEASDITYEHRVEFLNVGLREAVRKGEPIPFQSIYRNHSVEKQYRKVGGDIRVSQVIGHTPKLEEPILDIHSGNLVIVDTGLMMDEDGSFGYFEVTSQGLEQASFPDKDSRQIRQRIAQELEFKPSAAKGFDEGWFHIFSDQKRLESRRGDGSELLTEADERALDQERQRRGTPVKLEIQTLESRPYTIEDREVVVSFESFVPGMSMSSLSQQTLGEGATLRALLEELIRDHGHNINQVVYRPVEDPDEMFVQWSDEEGVLTFPLFAPNYFHQLIDTAAIKLARYVTDIRMRKMGRGDIPDLVDEFEDLDHPERFKEHARAGRFETVLYDSYSNRKRPIDHMATVRAYQSAQVVRTLRDVGDVEAAARVVVNLIHNEREVLFPEMGKSSINYIDPWMKVASVDPRYETDYEGEDKRFFINEESDRLMGILNIYILVESLSGTSAYGFMFNQMVDVFGITNVGRVKSLSDRVGVRDYIKEQDLPEFQSIVSDIIAPFYEEAYELDLLKILLAQIIGDDALDLILLRESSEAVFRKFNEMIKAGEAATLKKVVVKKQGTDQTLELDSLGDAAQLRGAFWSIEDLQFDLDRKESREVSVIAEDKATLEVVAPTLAPVSNVAILDQALLRFAPREVVTSSVIQTSEEHLARVPGMVVSMGVDEFAETMQARLRKRVESVDEANRQVLRDLMAMIDDLRSLNNIGYALSPNEASNEAFVNMVRQVSGMIDSLAFYTQGNSLGDGLTSNLKEADVSFQMYSRLNQMSRFFDFMMDRDRDAVGFVVPSDLVEDPSMNIQFDVGSDSVVVPVSVLQEDSFEDPVMDATVIAMQTVIALLLSHESKAVGRKNLLQGDVLADRLKQYDFFAINQLDGLLQKEGNSIRISTQVLRAYVSYMAELAIQQSA